jgi:hypothetical protein
MATQPATDDCLGCRSPLESLGVEHFRVGGVSGGWAALMGQWAEIGRASSIWSCSPAVTAAESSCASRSGAESGLDTQGFR